MSLERAIEEIRIGISASRFLSEAAVSQGVVLRLLHALGWPTYDTQVVWPEYSQVGRRVDFALCHPPGKPIAIIEVKQIGQSEGAERQLFDYAFHDGIPLAILTDGREWNFFLPAEQGDYGERRVYKLDILARAMKECVSRLNRYLLHSAVGSGEAIQAARDDYRNVARDRQMKAALPVAWTKLVEEEDDMLIEIMADRVESVCGFKPDPDLVLQFLHDIAIGPSGQSARSQPARPAQFDKQVPHSAKTQSVQPPGTALRHSPAYGGAAPTGNRMGYEIGGQFRSARNAIDVLRQLFDILIAKDPLFADRFAARPHARTRRYLARGRDELYRRPDLCQRYSVQLPSGWWMSTNHSRNTIETIIKLASDVAGLRYGQDLVAYLGE